MTAPNTNSKSWALIKLADGYWHSGNTIYSGGGGGGGTAPTSPTGVAAVGTGTANISVSWNAVAGAASYSVFRNGAQVATGITSTLYGDSGLATGASSPRNSPRRTVL